MDRIVDPQMFVADAAVIDWPMLIREQISAASRANREWRGTERGRELHLRWYVSGGAGIPPAPFTVWVRRDKDRFGALEAKQFADVVLWGGSALFALRVRCTPIDPGKPCALWAFTFNDGLASSVGVSEVVTSAAPVTLTVRAPRFTFARLVNARLDSAEAATVDDVVHGDWRELEYVGLPYDPEDWAGRSYHGDKQGMAGAETDPVSAALQRLDRAAPVVGWFPVTENGRAAPLWEPPDHRAMVDEVRKHLLENVAALYDPGVVPAAQAAIRSHRDVAPPTQDGRIAVATRSTIESPVFASAILAAGSDPFVALAAGFGTGYPLAGEIGQGPDLMVTATYPDGARGDGNAVEYAWPLPIPASHHTTAAPTGYGVGRAGLIDPVVRDQPWRETVALDWQAPPSSSLLFPRAASAAAARYDPAGGAPAEALLEPRDAGGLRPLAPMRRPAPNDDRIRLVDPERPLPMDSTPATTTYAVAVADPYGVWSRWVDATHSAVQPDQPIPAVGEVSFAATYAGSAQCAAVVEVTLTIDWSARSPAFVQVPLSIFPAPYHGAPTPAGVGPFSAVPGGTQRTLTFRFDALGNPASLTAGCTVEWIAQHSDDVVVAPGQLADAGDTTRRYRLRVEGLTLDYGAATHYGVAVWARELAAVYPGWGGLSPSPTRAFASSPVPVVVPAVPLPIVPLGGLPDAEGRSHVALRTALPGAAEVIVWTASETRVRQAAGAGPIPPPPPAPGGASLSERFVALKAAFAALSAEQRRAVFARDRDLAAGPATVDVALPRGSREIHLFTVTGRTAANVESPWPTSIDQYQAFAAPLLVTPGVPSISAAFTDDGGATRIGIELEVRSPVPVAAFELHRTYLPAITAAAPQMGPPIASVVAADSDDPPTPAGNRYTARFVDPSPGDWRTAYYRAVAVPAPGLTLDDQHNGRVGARSPDSSLASLRLPPEAPPSLTLVAVAPLGAAGDGVVIRVRTDARVAPNPLGPFTVRCTTDTGVSVDAVLGELRPTSAATPPAVVGGGAFTRDRRSGGTTELAAWLPRADPHSALAATVSITDPLGRSSTLVVPVPAEPATPAPHVAITGVRRAGLNVVVTFTLNAPTVREPGGDWRLDAFARRTAVFGLPAAVSVAVPDIPDAGDVPPNTPGALIVARRRSGGEATYFALVRLLRPFRLRLTLRTPDGRSASADRTVPGGPLP